MDKIIFYDLDHTLFDPTSIDKKVFQPAFDALETASSGTLSATAFKELTREFFTLSFNHLIEKYLTEELASFFVNQLRDIKTLPPLKPYADAGIVTQIPAVSYLITSGLTEFQQLKIDTLGIGHWFTEIWIDDPFDTKRKGKGKIMETIIKNNSYAPENIVVVGDNPESEIEAGNQLGLETIQICRPGIAPTSKAHHVFTGLADLKTYLSTFNPHKNE